MRVVVAVSCFENPLYNYCHYLHFLPVVTVLILVSSLEVDHDYLNIKSIHITINTTFLKLMMLLQLYVQ